MDRAEFDSRPLRWREAYIEHFRKNYGALFKQICDLHEIKSKLECGELLEEDIIMKLDDVISLRRRHDPGEFQRLQRLRKNETTKVEDASNENYQMVVERGVMAAIDASQKLKTVLEALKAIDIENAETMFFWMNAIRRRANLPETDWLDLMKEIKTTSAALSICATALALATGVKLDAKVKRGKSVGGRPPLLNYLDPTRRLMDLWIDLTDTRFTVPHYTKRQKHHEQVFRQRPAEFVRLALKMINSSISFSQIKTSIENVMLFDQVMFSDSDESKLKTNKAKLMRQSIEDYESFLEAIMSANTKRTS
jgi:hypothetical protein